MSARCRFGDPACPCPDGLACHYVDLPGSPAMAAPADQRPGVDPKLWLGVATSTLVLVFCAVVVHLARLAL